ncbi:MAG: TIM barrel protein [Nitrospiraceae bacterium]|nr:TIM barrel protein [Nitrospiraceae bacterium]
MNLNVNYWMVGGFEGEVGVVEAGIRAKNCGYDGIELCFGAGVLTPDTTESELESLRSELEREGVPVGSLATGHYWTQSLSSPDPEERSAAVAFTKSYIRAARLLGTDAVLVVPGSVDVGWDPSRPVVPVAQVWMLAEESLREVLPVAEERQVTVCIENVWNKFLTGPFEFAAFVDSFESPWLKAYFDVGNCLLVGYPEHWIEVLAERIGRVHFKNFSRRDCAGTLNDFTSSLLEGDVNWPAVLGALGAVGYDGNVAAEVIVGENGMPDLDLAARVAAEMRQIIEGNAQ